jgi:putative transposase
LARQPRMVFAGVPHHVTHRGNRRGDIFLERTDRDLYSSLLHTVFELNAVDVWAYCLMRNHVHLLLVPWRTESLGRAIKQAHSQYARIVNRRQNWTGHLFANRFYSTALDDAHLWQAARYIESNPVRAGLVARAEDFPWSSARAHVRGIPDPLLSSGRPFPGAIEDWSGWLSEGLPETVLERIRNNTQTGRVTGHLDLASSATAALRGPRPRGPAPMWKLRQ